MAVFEIKTTNRGFYFAEMMWDVDECLSVVESSAIADKYPDADENPGSSYLIVGECRIDREEVTALRDLLTTWLETKSLSGTGRPEKAQ